MKYAILTTLNPNAINVRYGRTPEMCDTPVQYDIRDVVEASSSDAAFLLAQEIDYGYPVRLLAGVKPAAPLYGATYNTESGEEFGKITSVFQVDADWGGYRHHGYCWPTQEQVEVFLGAPVEA